MPDSLHPVQSYTCGEWYFGKGKTAVLRDSYTGDEFCRVCSDGIDFKSVLEYGRNVGRRVLPKMTFPQRGIMLKKLALYLMEKKELFYELSYRSGATRRDSWIDIEGGIGNLFSYASLRRHFADTPHMTEGDDIALSNNGSFSARNVSVPKEGVALHINAYNFPIWGMLEKIAVNLLAGMPAIVKPATASCYLTEIVVRAIVESKILPEGSLQLICGSVGDTFNHLICQDVVTFTGSFLTGIKLKQHRRVMSESVPFNMETDSLNCTILAEDAEPGNPEFDLFIKEVSREMTVKCGQKCTAIRRILVPASKADAVLTELSKKLKKIQPGNPRLDTTRMGTMISHDRVNDVIDKIKQLSNESEMVLGTPEKPDVSGAAILNPVLMYNARPKSDAKVHEVEAFGPVSTVIPYESTDDAVELANLGKGSLCCSVITADPALAQSITIGCGGYHGRVLILNRENQKTSTGHGSPLPLLIHGGPGRAGGGEEMGGLRGIKHYMQCFSLQAPPTFLTAVTGKYHQGGTHFIDERHPFRKFYEDLKIGETLITHKRTFTEADISNFSNLTWDHFFAHTDITALDGTIFERPVVHGYLVLSAAAGLFVDPVKGNVLLNYGVEDCRFVKPIYAGDTIGVRLTVKEKIPRDKKESDLCPQGIVKFLVDVYDQDNDTVAVATILTMVRAKNILLS